MMVPLGVWFGCSSSGPTLGQPPPFTSGETEAQSLAHIKSEQPWLSGSESPALPIAAQFTVVEGVALVMHL